MTPRNGKNDGQIESVLNSLDSDTGVPGSVENRNFSPGEIVSKPLGGREKEAADQRTDFTVSKARMTAANSYECS